MPRTFPQTSAVPALDDWSRLVLQLQKATWLLGQFSPFGRYAHSIHIFHFADFVEMVVEVTRLIYHLLHKCYSHCKVISGNEMVMVALQCSN